MAPLFDRHLSLTMRISYFITPHGFGHAARAAAVMEALHALDLRVEFEIFTKVPEWFFKDSLSRKFLYRPLLTDIGLAQETPFATDLPQTLKLLHGFYPLDPEIIDRLSGMLKNGRSRLVVCDIAPMGIAAAKRAGIPCVLVENFTWDWIYEDYAAEHKEFTRHIGYLKSIFSSVDHRIQTKPVCRPCRPALTTSPVSRKPRTPALQVREELGLHSEAKLVLVTAGGIPSRSPSLERISGDEKMFFLIPGAGKKMQVMGSVILLPHRSGFFHPDLVNASDGVVGKAGYSTLAEVYWAGVPFGYVSRTDFRESEVLASFIESNMRGIALKEEEMYEGTWISRVPELLSMKRIRRGGVNGAHQIAEAILQLIQQ
jgi:hypothetical protein